MMSPALTAEFVLLAAIWGASFLFMRAGALEFGPVGTAFLRVLLAGAVLLPLVLWRGQLGAWRGRIGTLLVVGLLNSGLPFVLYAWGVLHISTGLASILNATTPLWGALVAWLWLNDRLDRLRAVGLALGFAGVLLLSWNKAGAVSAALAVLACLTATLCYGIAGSYTRKYLTGMPPLAAAAGSLCGAALWLAPAALLWMPPLTGPDAPGWRAWGAVALLAVLCTAVAYVLYFRLIERAGPQRALTVTYLIPVFGVGYGVALLGEALTGWMLACGAVIVLGTALATGYLEANRLRALTGWLRGGATTPPG